MKDELSTFARTPPSNFQHCPHTALQFVNDSEGNVTISGILGGCLVDNKFLTGKQIIDTDKAGVDSEPGIAVIYRKHNVDNVQIGNKKFEVVKGIKVCHEQDLKNLEDLLRQGV